LRGLDADGRKNSREGIDGRWCAIKQGTVGARSNDMGYNVAIVGGSLTGLAAGTVLHRLGHTFTIFEKFHAPFSDRGSSLGFVDIALWQHLTGRQMTRYNAQAHRSQGAYFYGDLWTFLYNGLPAGSVQFGQEVTDLGSDPLRPVVQGQPFDAVIVADGGWSKLRHLVTGKVKQPEYAGHVIYRSKCALSDFQAAHGTFVGEGVYTVNKVFAIALDVGYNDGRRMIMGGVAVSQPEGETVRPAQVCCAVCTPATVPPVPDHSFVYFFFFVPR